MRGGVSFAPQQIASDPQDSDVKGVFAPVGSRRIPGIRRFFDASIAGGEGARSDGIERISRATSPRPPISAPGGRIAKILRAGELSSRAGVLICEHTREINPMKSALLWLVGIPIPLIIIANLAGWL